MRKNIILLLLICLLVIVLLFIAGCPEKTEYNPPDKLIIAEEIFHLYELNSIYDDYNSTGPPNFKDSESSYDIDFIFSSNYRSSGNDFDIDAGYIDLSYRIYMNWNKQNKSKDFSSYRGTLNSAADILNLEESNEFSPFIIRYIGFSNEHKLLFSSDRKNSGDNTSDLNIYLLDNKNIYSFFGNTDKNEKYICYDFKNDYVYFASDNTGDKYNIYRVKNNYCDVEFGYTGTEFKDWFINSVNKVNIEEVAELNSNGNDTCPYINNDIMLFASDRTSDNYGGYDIYYSYYDLDTDKWSAPKNIGNLINTKHNEFRPSLYSPDYTYRSTYNYGVIFSSDRPTGKGGYDLYFGILKEGKF